MRQTARRYSINCDTRTCSMSQMGQARSSADVRAMSAFPPEAVVQRTSMDGKFVPIAAVSRCSNMLVTRPPRRRGLPPRRVRLNCPGRYRPLLPGARRRSSNGSTLKKFSREHGDKPFALLDREYLERTFDNAPTPIVCGSWQVLPGQEGPL